MALLNVKQLPLGSGKRISDGLLGGVVMVVPHQPRSQRRKSPWHPTKHAQHLAQSQNQEEGGGAALKSAKEEIAAQKEEISELNLNVDALTKERDFYFGKLRDVEILIQEKEGEVDETVKEAFEQIKAILYATDEGEEEEDF